MDEHEESKDTFGNARRAMAQVFLTRKIMTRTEAEAQWAAACSRFGEPDDVEAGFLSPLNERLSEFGMELRRCCSGVTGEEEFVLVLRKFDDLQDLLTMRAPDKRFVNALFKALVRKGYVDIARDSIVVEKKSTRLTTQKALLVALADDGWVVPTPDASTTITLSNRSKVELESLLIEWGAVECPLCNELTIYGARRCPSGCSARLHAHCELRLAASGMCPQCRQPWPVEVEES
eukprot:PLAT2910.1.p1 GENE.PLAT2910.1~~PLAT2910.1.p1  ORF type:complete len:268 (+),score=52.82 PLAT2910.1:103-804(+)